MPIVVLGDSCSGKSTLLLALKSQGYPVVFETGWQDIPSEIERNKELSNRWFCRYFLERDRAYYPSGVIFERCLQFQIPFSRAQLAVGKITSEQYISIMKTLAEMDRELPLSREAIIIHLTVDSKLIWERLKRRLGTMPDQRLYWDTLRQETGSYFSAWPAYHRVDTTYKTPGDVLELVRGFLSN